MIWFWCVRCICVCERRVGRSSGKSSGVVLIIAIVVIKGSIMTGDFCLRATEPGQF